MVSCRRVDPSGLTDKDMEAIKIESDPVYMSKRAKSIQQMREEREKAKAAIPLNTKDEDRVLFWMWGKINPTYGRYLRKDKLLSYLD